MSPMELDQRHRFGASKFYLTLDERSHTIRSPDKAERGIERMSPKYLKLVFYLSLFIIGSALSVTTYCGKASAQVTNCISQTCPNNASCIADIHNPPGCYDCNTPSPSCCPVEKQCRVQWGSCSGSPNVFCATRICVPKCTPGL